MTVTEHWTGASATALRRAMRLTNEGYADKLGVSVRTVAKWRAQPDMEPTPQLQQVLDTVLEQCDLTSLERFAAMNTPATDSPSSVEPLGPTLHQALEWTDEQAGWAFGTAERQVRARIAGMTEADRSRLRARRDVPRSRLAEAVSTLYTSTADAYLYCADVDGRPILTCILTQDVWVDRAFRLEPTAEQFTVDYAATPPAKLTEIQAAAAVERIAELAVGGARIFNADLYALRDLGLGDSSITGTLGLTRFVPYALTTDLVEDELARAILTGPAGVDWESLPLRNAELPTAESALDFSGRTCVGGALALVAIARPASRAGRPADYLLLIQERSSQVVNGTGSISVVPKAFHQPLGDYREDAAISATLEREFEEELLGRSELEAVMSDSAVDSRHPQRLSPAMRALVDGDEDSWSAECTGFGVNLASGNYEFASLVAIHDERWWLEHGGDLSGNWETDGVRRYSSRDRDGLAHLITDDRWSNEGLFAFLQGLRRLAEIAPDRVAVPAIHLKRGTDEHEDLQLARR